MWPWNPAAADGGCVLTLVRTQPVLQEERKPPSENIDIVTAPAGKTLPQLRPTSTSLLLRSPRPVSPLSSSSPGSLPDSYTEHTACILVQSPAKAERDLIEGCIQMSGWMAPLMNKPREHERLNCLHNVSL